MRDTPSACRGWRPVADHLFCGNDCGRGERSANRLLHKGLPHFLASLESILGIFGEGFPNDGIDPAGNRRVNERRRDGILIHDLVEDGRDIAGKGLFAGQQFVEDSTQGEDVGAMIHFLAGDLLGSHVAGRADDQPGHA